MTTKLGLILFICVTMGILLVQFLWNQKKNHENFLKKARMEFGRMPDRTYQLEEKERFSHYFKNICDKTEFYLDELTWNDLGMEEIFLLMNQTYSSIGEEYLYFLLRTPVTNRSILEERHRLIRYFQTHEAERLMLQTSYQQLGRKERYSVSDYLIRLMTLPEQKNTRHYLVIAAELASVALLWVNGAVGGLCLMASLAYGIADYYKQKGKTEPYVICLRQIAGMLEQIENLPRLTAEELERYLSELSHIGKSCQHIRKGARLVGSNHASDSMGQAVMEYVRMLTHIDLIQFSRMLRLIKKKKSEIARMIEIFGLLESMIAAASFREWLGTYCVPEFSNDSHPSLSVDMMYHPMLEKPVKNSMSANGGILITGSNASGKSTFLKTIGICSVLAQTIMTVPANSYRASYFRLYSSMAIRDSISRKESYYLAEIKALQRILLAGNQRREQDMVSGEYVLCLVDEVLRGTNTVERIAASAQVLKELAKNDFLCIAATHDLELTYMLERFYTNYHFEEEICDGDVHFDYRLRAGRSLSRNAIRLLASLGYPEEMIQMADIMAREFIEKGEWRCL